MARFDGSLGVVAYITREPLNSTIETMVSHKPKLHPRNRNNSLYDFEKLIHCCPDLKKYIIKTHASSESIDYSNPNAVKTLNKAILKFYYNIIWDLPEGFLCPPIPGRADYIHSIADLLSESNSGVIPQGSTINVLDIGVGANCIYPLLGFREYGWNFVGTEINEEAMKIAQNLINLNDLSSSITLFHQKNPNAIFAGLPKDIHFDISMCNPPFHRSKSEALEGTKRKFKNLNIKTNQLNFGGNENELWCPGGEVGFITRMIQESSTLDCKWFTTLVSKEASLFALYKELKRHQGIETRTISMGQGQKKSRIVAWTFGH